MIRDRTVLPSCSHITILVRICAQLIGLLAKNKLVQHQSIPYDGYRLTAKGYDYLALKSLAKRETVSALGIQIGVGKESDIFTIITPDGVEVRPRT